MLGRARAMLGAAHRSGNVYAVLSGASALCAAGLYLSSQRELEARREREAQFDAMLAAERIRASDEVAARTARLQDAPVLWRAVVTQYDPTLQGHRMLRGSRPGAGVDVLEENVGDGGKYLMVRDRETGAMGFILDRWVRSEGDSAR